MYSSGVPGWLSWLNIQLLIFGSGPDLSVERSSPPPPILSVEPASDYGASFSRRKKKTNSSSPTKEASYPLLSLPVPLCPEHWKPRIFQSHADREYAGSSLSYEGNRQYVLFCGMYQWFVPFYSFIFPCVTNTMFSLSLCQLADFLIIYTF